MGVTTCHAVRHNFSIQTIFSVHTLQITENQHYQAARSSTKSVSFGSVWFEWVRRVLGTLFPVTSAGEKCKGSVRHGRRHDYLLFVSCIVYHSASAFIKIKNQNYKQNFSPLASSYYVTRNLPFTAEVQDCDFSAVCVCYTAVGYTFQCSMCLLYCSWL